MLVIGLTGGIASGKSTAAAELTRLGIPVFDADAAARAVVSKGSEGLALVGAALGKEFITADGELDRAGVAALVFKDKVALKTLEGIIHKLVWERAEVFLADCIDKKTALAVLDVPLLIECGWHERVDKVWLVALSEQEQLARAVARGGMSKEDAAARLAAQMPLTEKKKYADTVLDNSGTKEQLAELLRGEVEKVLSGLKKEKRK